MKVSATGRALIEKFEGCVLHAYQDVVGVWTIGYGHTEGVYEGQVITQADADQMLSDDLDHEYGPGVQAAIGDAPTTQAQFDAMVSLAYNIGIGGFAGSTVCRQHRAGNYLAAADAFSLWNKAGGKILPPLARRRVEEEKLYLSDLPGAQRPVAMVPTYTHADCARDMQKALKTLGLYTDKIDGDWATNSRAAYIKFIGE